MWSLNFFVIKALGITEIVQCKKSGFETPLLSLLGVTKLNHGYFLGYTAYDHVNLVAENHGKSSFEWFCQ